MRKNFHENVFLVSLHDSSRRAYSNNGAFHGLCSSPTGRKIPAATGSPVVTPGQGAPVPANTGVSASLPYGVTISVPADWTRQDVRTSGVRDYGTTTLNIANFYSPNAITGDQASYTPLTSMSIRTPERTLKVLQQRYPCRDKDLWRTTTVEAHSYTITISGHKSYELDFQTEEVKGTYIFTSTENGMYIFAFKVPNKPQAVRVFQGAIVDIYKSIRINPPTVVVTQYR